MLAKRKSFIFFMGLTMVGLIFLQPSYAEMRISEKSLPEDTVIEEFFQAGTGLPVGKILSLRGDVIIFHRDPAVGFRAKTGLPLYQGDTIRTQNGAKIMCRLIDGSQFVLMPHSSLLILRCNYNSARKTSLSFVTLGRGDALFQVQEPADLTSFDFKIQTDTVFAQAKKADFTVKAGPEKTEIITFEESRLEATSLADPERIIFLSDFQRLVVGNELGSPFAESLSQTEAMAMKAEYRLTPQTKLFASSPEKYRTDRPQGSIEELRELEENAIDY